MFAEERPPARRARPALHRQAPASIEGQLVNLCDEIAYNNHDIDDGLRSGLISLEQLAEVPVFARNRAAVEAEYPGLAGRRLIHETIRRMINLMAVSLIRETSGNIRRHGVETLADVHAAPRLVAYGEALQEDLQACGCSCASNSTGTTRCCA